MINKILNAMKADHIPANTSGLWTVSKLTITPDKLKKLRALKLAGKINHQMATIPLGDYTLLSCLTLKTLNHPPGDTVMNDLPYELKKHLEFIMTATGRVLIGGLGLGCVIRGLLARGTITTIDIIERSADVIKLCGDSVTDPRVTIHNQDATHDLKGGPWDYAWWDLWSDTGEPHLQVTHMQLIKQFRNRIKERQGAWAMPRKHRRSLKRAGIML